MQCLELAICVHLFFVEHIGKYVALCSADPVILQEVSLKVVSGEGYVTIHAKPNPFPLNEICLNQSSISGSIQSVNLGI